MSEKLKRIFALDYGRGTMAGFYVDYGAKDPTARPIMDKDGEPSGFARMTDGTCRVGNRMYSLGTRDLANVAEFHVNVKELPTGNDDLQVEYAKAWRDWLVEDNKALFSNDTEETWIIGCPTGWRKKSIIDKYRQIFEKAGFKNVIIVPESNAAMMFAQRRFEFVEKMDKKVGVLCMDLGAYSADSTYVRPGKVESYGGYVGASLIERMILRMNLEGEFCENARNKPELRQAFGELCESDAKFRTLMLLQAKKLKETYFTDSTNGQDYSDGIDCSLMIDLRIDNPEIERLGAKRFELVVNDEMIAAITRERSVKDVLGREFDTLPEEVRNELGDKTWDAALRVFIKNTLSICPEFAEAAQGAGTKADLILTGGASLMPFVRDSIMAILPNVNLWFDREPMSTIAMGLAYFGPDKMKALEFDAEFQHILTHDENGNETDSTNSLLNVITSRAHDELGIEMLATTVGKMTGSIVDAVGQWSSREIDSSSIIPNARAAFKAWFEGGMVSDYHKKVEDTKEFIAAELNERFQPLFDRFKLAGSLLKASDIDLEYAENFLKWHKSNFQIFDEQIAEEDKIYSKLSNPGLFGSIFGTSREEEISAVADTLNKRNENWRDAVLKDLIDVFNSSDIYRPFLHECVYEIGKALATAKRTRLGELVVEESFDDDEN